MPDIFIKCVECLEEFEHTESDQEFYRERQFTPPKRCRACRIKKKMRFDDKKPRQESPSGESSEFGSREY